MAEETLDGRYLYCVVDAGASSELEGTGVDGQKVYAIPHLDIAVLSHKCAAKGYEPKDEKAIIDYVQKHNGVVNHAFNTYGAVLPLKFNTIIKETNGDSDEAVKGWLAMQYADLKGKLKMLRGKEEYGVRVFVNRERLRKEILDKSQTILELKKKIGADNSSGRTYLYKQMIENAVKKEIQETIKERVNEACSLMKKHSVYMRLGKLDRTGREKIDGGMLQLNASCLVGKENVGQFKAGLETLGASDLLIRITGPWAPYSFV